MTTQSHQFPAAVRAGLVTAGGYDSIFSNAPDVAQISMATNISRQANIISCSTEHSFGLLPTIIGIESFNTRILTAIRALPDPSLVVNRPLVVTLRAEQEEWIASFDEAEIARAGSSPNEALEWLTSSVSNIFKLYSRTRKLGPLPAKQLAVLRKYIGQKPNRSR